MVIKAVGWNLGEGACREPKAVDVVGWDLPDGASQRLKTTSESESGNLKEVVSWIFGEGANQELEGGVESGWGLSEGTSREPDGTSVSWDPDEVMEYDPDEVMEWYLNDTIASSYLGEVGWDLDEAVGLHLDKATRRVVGGLGGGGKN